MAEVIQRKGAPPVYVGEPENHVPPTSTPRCQCNNCPNCGRPR